MNCKTQLPPLQWPLANVGKRKKQQPNHQMAGSNYN